MNQDGIVKVWFNSDLSKNYFSLSKESSPSERQMITEIINLIDRNVDKET